MPHPDYLKISPVYGPAATVQTLTTEGFPFYVGALYCLVRGVDAAAGKLGTVFGTDAVRRAEGKKEAPRFITLGLPLLRGGRDSKASDDASPREPSRGVWFPS